MSDEQAQIEPADPALYAAPRVVLDAAARLLRRHGYVVSGTVDPRCTDILAAAARCWPVRDWETYHAEHPAVLAHAMMEVIRTLRAEVAGWRGSQEATAALLAGEFQRGAEAMREAAAVECLGVSQEIGNQIAAAIRALPVPERRR